MQSPIAFTIPISVKRNTQRTLKLVGYGVKSILTTKISGKLVVRKRLPGVQYDGVLAWHTVPPKPDPKRRAPPPADDMLNGDPRTVPHVDPVDLHNDLVSNGIKVRDFAYPATRRGHTKPVEPHPMLFTPEAAAAWTPNIPLSPEVAPVPVVPMTWEEPHPSLRPLPKCDWPGTFEVPTPEKPYQPVYETHRIPGWFEQSSALTEHDYRLSQNPRTLPIRGLTSRRLLTLSPHLVDLARYDEIDLEELRRYDRRVVWQLMQGIEPYPWRAVHPVNWVPSAETRQKIFELGKEMAPRWDAPMQREVLTQFLRERLADDEMEFQLLKQCHYQNFLLLQEDPSDGPPPFDNLDEFGVTKRQRLEAWARRMHTARAEEQYATKLEGLKKLRAYDAAARAYDVARGDVDADGDVDATGEVDAEMDAEMTDVAAPTPALPFIPGQYDLNVPHFAYWGPNAAHEAAAYRRGSAPSSGKTLGEHVAELSRCTAEATPWPIDGTRDYYALHLLGMVEDIFKFADEDRYVARISCFSDKTIGHKGYKGPETKPEEEDDDDGEEEEEEAPAPVEPAPSPSRKRGIDEVEPAQDVEESEGPSPKRPRT
ncbi:hypothetical protein DFH09DRAFT_466615 [Mycena vulgaris]|nr:hypothetical protein DFH09DRAFT_466615 [Mycena vulgaris]